MPGFDGIIGQLIPVRILQNFLKKGSIPHALLFTGMAGIGKRTSARMFAMALNCSARTNTANGRADGSVDKYPCLRCRNCRQIENGSHPDVLLIEPQGSVLRIDQIRRLLAILAMKPHHAGHRVVIIADAHAMNAEAGNALLKALEEPPADTYLVLTARSKSDLLPTIVSRCQHIRFNPLNTLDVQKLLSANQLGDTGHAETIARLSGGSFKKARDLAQGDWLEKRNWLIRAAGFSQLDRTVQNALTRALAFAGHLSQQKEQATEFLVVFQTWIRDLCIWPYAPQFVINSDYREILARIRPRMDDRQLVFLWECIETAQKAIAANANIRLTLEVMVLRMAEYGLA